MSCGRRAGLWLLALFLNLPFMVHADVLSNMIAWWRFEEGVGTSVTDLSSNQIPGTITSGTWESVGRYGKALTLAVH